jgi:bidirectional [NiFe] hydrogenase diaphorase subunit
VSGPIGKQRGPPLLAGTDERQWRAVDARVRKLGANPGALIEVLHTVQESFGYLDEESLSYVSNALHVPPSKVYGVATFYSHFSLKPAGEHAAVVCTGTACYINGASGVIDAIAGEYGVRPGETTDDGHLSILTARCVGACSLAPVMVVDGRTIGRLNPERTVEALREI